MENVLSEQDAPSLDSLLDKVYRDGGYDFRNYRRGTVMRRLARRLHATGSSTYLDYMRFLDDYPEEYQKLADDLTIKTSGFFRSPYSCQKVTEMVLPELLRHKESEGEHQIRLWSAACGRGEEPYSIAILLADFLGQRRDFAVTIYATDISRRALREAQAGTYTTKDVECLSPEILRNHFVQRNQDYEIKADIREKIYFSYFDLTSTVPPPLFNLDCIFCCNVLIYFQKPLQERVLNMLYDCLAVPGYLVLGEVESLTNGLYSKLQCLDSKAKVYRKVTA